MGRHVSAACGPQALRSYRVAAAENVRRAYGSGAESVVFVLPTGGGKTVIFVFIVDNAVALGRRVLVIAHRQEIIAQISAALTLAGIGHGLIASGHPETNDLVQLASVASVGRQHRLRRWVGKFDFIVATRPTTPSPGHGRRFWPRSLARRFWASQQRLYVSMGAAFGNSLT